MPYVAWVLECKINDRAAVEGVMTDMVAAVEADEPGTVQYEWSISEDGTTLITNERFVDAAAALVHLGNFGAFAERFLAALSPVRFTVFGSPSAEVKEAAAGFGPAFYEPVGGFIR